MTKNWTSARTLTAIAAAILAATLPALSAPAFAQDAPPAKHDIVEYCKTLAADNGFTAPGGCVGFFNSYPNAYPAQVCKYLRIVGYINNQQFADCVAYFRDLGA